VLALLIAFNSTRISVEERRREHATMLAFGVPVRRVVGTVVAEAFVVGVLATAIGIVTGLAVLQWILDSLAERTLPDFEIARYASPATLGVAVLVGVVAVSITPLFLARRIGKMNLPDTLRVME
jgi:putative ABC transport system permease protein